MLRFLQKLPEVTCNTAMDGKHLRNGDANPPMPNDKLRLYSMRFCPYAQRSHLVLDAKKIPYDIVNINLKEKPDWFLKKNPLGKVPAIELPSGDIIYESLIIADFLDEKYPASPLHNKDVVQKAKDKILIEKFNQVCGLVFKLAEKGEGLQSLLEELDAFEKTLESRGKEFFGGDKPGMVDYMLWPWFERVAAYKELDKEKFAIPKDRYTKLGQWKKAMMEDEAVKVSYISPEYHNKFLTSFLFGAVRYDADYDILAK